MGQTLDCFCKGTEFTQSHRPEEAILDSYGQCEPGFNIVSLPAKIDELKYSMSNNLIDLIAFNETRLDPNITNNMIHLNDHDLIRKNRSRNGGGVCIY